MLAPYQVLTQNMQTMTISSCGWAFGTILNKKFVSTKRRSGLLNIVQYKPQSIQNSSRKNSGCDIIPRNIKIGDDDHRFQSDWTVDAYLIKSSNFAIYNILFLWININTYYDMKTLHVCIRDQNTYHWYKSKRFGMNLISLRYPLHFLISTICSYSSDDSSQSNTVSTQFFHGMMKQNG